MKLLTTILFSLMMFAVQAQNSFNTNIRVTTNGEYSSAMEIKYNILFEQNDIQFDCLSTEYHQLSFKYSVKDTINIRFEQENENSPKYKFVRLLLDDGDELTLMKLRPKNQLVAVIVHQINGVDLIYGYKKEDQEKIYSTKKI